MSLASLKQLFVLAVGIRSVLSSPALGIFMPDEDLQQRAISRDPSDFSWIKRYAAIGDSFAAGIGVGNVLNGPGDSACSRYDGAAAELINQTIGPSPHDYQFLACTGATSSQIKDQIKNLHSQDLVTVSAGGNDVGFEDVLKNCVYLPHPESDCDRALGTAENLINNNLEKNIDGLLDELNKKIAVNGIVIYAKYAKFFNADTDPCSDKTWTFIDPTGSSGLKLTKDRRKRLNDMVDSANQKIQNAINNFHERYEFAKMDLVTASWDDFVGAIKGRFCEDGAPDNPNDNLGLAFQNVDNSPSYIPPEKKLAVAKGPIRHDNRAIHRQPLEPRVPDSIARVFHPSELGQTVIAAISMLALTQARNKLVNSNSGGISCPHNTKPKMPGADALDPTGKHIEVTCGKCTDFYQDPNDVGSAISKYCSEGGKNFYPGDYSVSHANGQQSQIFTSGYSVKNEVQNIYKDKKACSNFNERINSDDCNFALQAINKKCNPTGGSLNAFCPGSYTYNCVGWDLYTSS